jgi:hypothetical protein
VAYQQNEEAVEEFLKKAYPEIKKEVLGFFVLLGPVLDKGTNIGEKERVLLGRWGRIPGSKTGTIPVQRC